jgi:NAD-dependent deacetylase
VYELHGSYRQTSCLDCGSEYNMDGVMERVKFGENPPPCEECGGVLKPKAVFFGEMLPQTTWMKSVDITQKSDLFLVMGSSLQVSPANVLPDVALCAGARLVIVNLMPTPYDGDAHLTIHHKIGEFACLSLEVLNLKFSS